MTLDLSFKQGEHICCHEEDGFPDRSYAVDVWLLLQHLYKTGRTTGGKIPINKFDVDKMMTEKCWADKRPESADDTSGMFSPQQLLNDPTISAIHTGKLEQCDIRYPVLILEHSDGSFGLVDGMHRLVKCVQQSLTDILAIKLTREDLEAAEWNGES
ncbi:hypothetical protein HK100_009354 [Physocladia obscura]|uniref:ParB/Sulfiredoxin domain-containing protein n=1 Tax=Physocladia obscura TaxID=109957 RepID=A0AAD5SLZ9_9FUNG|nr:hypothetical protein HK100_009354 [Physocladia obscura]